MVTFYIHGCDSVGRSSLLRHVSHDILSFFKIKKKKKALDKKLKTSPFAWTHHLQMAWITSRPVTVIIYNNIINLTMASTRRLLHVSINSQLQTVMSFSLKNKNCIGWESHVSSSIITASDQCFPSGSESFDFFISRSSHLEPCFCLSVTVSLSLCVCVCCCCWWFSLFRSNYLVRVSPNKTMVLQK